MSLATLIIFNDVRLKISHSTLGCLEKSSIFVGYRT